VFVTCVFAQGLHAIVENAFIATGGQKPVWSNLSLGGQNARKAIVAGIFLALCCVSLPASAQAPAPVVNKGSIVASAQDGYARIVLDFSDRDSLPSYGLRMENGVLSIEFADPIDISVPDLGVLLPAYVSMGRVDPDGRGMRFALRDTLNFNKMEAGEKLFIDLMPLSWQGMPPGLPQEVVDELAERARQAAIRAEQQRKAEGVIALNPSGSLRIGHNPTFFRLQFDWTVPTKAEFVQTGDDAVLNFEWPVPVNLEELQLLLPPEIELATNTVTPDGSMIDLNLANDITPRFYQSSPTQAVLDFDLSGGAKLPEFSPAALEAAAAAAHATTVEAEAAAHIDIPNPLTAGTAETVVPFINVLGSTVRVVFPFVQDTPAAVFRRGNTVWMIFDTVAGIAPLAKSDDLDNLTAGSGFSVMPAGDTQVVRIDLNDDRLATLGSEGMAWVLSLGDTMLAPTEPIELSRRRDIEGLFEITADVARPARVHEFRDPEVGDVLKVVTAYPPARGVLRSFDYVDFQALRSVHGFVVKPEHLDVEVAIDNNVAVVKAPGGLTVSTFDRPRVLDGGVEDVTRSSFIDLARLAEQDPTVFEARRGELMSIAASTDGRTRDMARLDLAQYYIANHFAMEAIGVLHVLESQLKSDNLTRKVRMTKAIADTLAYRPREAVDILNAASLDEEADALMWRTIARADNYDFPGARADALAAQGVEEAYPAWVRVLFQLSATRAAVETGDTAFAEHLLEAIDVSLLTPEQVSLYQLLSGRLDEEQGRDQEAIDTYGQVIASEVRPTRAEAIYRTMILLDKAGKLDLPKATQTLSAEAMLWRGNPLEASMQKMLAELYFRQGQYRSGFEVVKQAVSTYPESPPINALRDKAEDVFGDLYLNGLADTMAPIDALALFYDFRHLTPSGTGGDEMIRNLARRLVRMDLLPQAAQLLEYQLDNRLTGVGRTQLAADLAVIHLANRDPASALRVLSATRLPDIPDSLARQRRILEVRALIDGGRDELALDMLRGMEGRDAELLRVDAHWRAKRYTQAAEMLEGLYSSTPGTELNQAARSNLVRSAVGFVLGRDTFGLSRLRTKFADAMVTQPEWPIFDLVTGNIETTSIAFKTVARQVSDVDSINAFLASYRETYGGAGAMTPLEAADSPGAVASAL